MSRPDPLGTQPVTWKLTDLYVSATDPAVQKDIDRCQTEAARLHREHGGQLASLTPAAMLALVQGLEEVATILGRLATLAFLRFTTQTGNAEAAAFLQRIREVASRVGTETVFFELEWNSLDAAIADRLCQAAELAPFRHYLESMRRYAPHLLSKSEETLLLEIAPVGRGSWTNLFDKVMGHLSFGQNRRTEEEVLADLYAPDRAVRSQAATDLTKGLQDNLHILCHVFNTVLADKMIEDRLRHYGSWLSAMNLNNELADSTVAVLVGEVTARYDIPARYYRLKRRLLGLDELLDYDRYAPLPELPDSTIPWSACRDMVLTAFNRFSPRMAEIAQLFFDKEWIHAPIMEGKRGGAFAHPCVPQVHPYIMVNYTGNLRDVATVAHELGHGVHQYLAADQGYFNSQTTLVLAETASVFAELLVFTDQLDRLTDAKARQAFVCQKLESIFATVFRQVAMNRFEDSIHTARKEHGELAPEDFARLWRASQQAMFGDSVTLTADYDIWWSYIPHFLNSPGYVYSYAFGELLVLALYRRYQQEGESFVPRYLELLAAGGSKSPYDLVQPFGVDLNDPAFWQGGLELIDTMLRSVED
ncbi:MAG: oligoendopeptidase F [Deltaproteobacteria bacterium CG23_combo_of_CG06-09_8_20_14_all_60_8]|nr:MAG: oligoendopeptidase F [Desulfobacterales bacterium CG2_30_60_27]PIP43612.1 MAG: oligoendopeptidase F [Deltaproteobacteria bacterium CG23_combo_of_CG06-09_8_20_14_all_60_8]